MSIADNCALFWTVLIGAPQTQGHVLFFFWLKFYDGR